MFLIWKSKGRQSFAERLRRRQPTVNLYNVGCFDCLSASNRYGEGLSPNGCLPLATQITNH
ncbi:MAG: hypothetical protein LBU34_07800 [Planctomycetaceae bacterium]|nr:hypothetical protein [Planctomycetaceae bacterium]